MDDIMSSHLDSFLAILFADISQSTKLYEKYGNAQALKIVSGTLGLLKKQVDRHYGAVIKTIGDEIMCSFVDPDRAVVAACAMQEAVRGHPKLSAMNISVRIGVHVGEVIFQGNDLFGDAVNVASRAVDLAGAEQIITTGATIGLMSEDLGLKNRSIGLIKVKGKRSTMEFFEIVWRDDPMDMTLIATDTFNISNVPGGTLKLTFKGKTVELNAKKPMAYMGRGEQNDLQVVRPFVSKRHASLELNEGKFVLTDHSVNGIHINMGERKNVFLHKDSIVLTDHGVMSLGRGFDKSDAQVVHFSIT